nr:MAG TPA: hypothetical protein [Caudoviricetes sp.]
MTICCMSWGKLFTHWRLRGERWLISLPSAGVVVVILRAAGRLALRGRR